MLLERLNEVDWTWLVYVEMFVAGIAAGAYAAATFLEWSGRGRSPLARVAHLVPFPLMALATLILIVDLRRPERFWHMAIMSDRYLPLFKPWSPMSAGTWLVILFTGVAFISFLDALVARRVFRAGGWRADRTLHGSPFGGVWSGIGLALAAGVGIYSGALLTATNLPGWADSPLLPAVYVATAMITGVAAVVLIQAVRGETDADLLGLARANAWLVGWWLLVVVLFLATLGSGAPFFLAGLPLVAIVAAIALAGVLPLALHLLAPGDRATSLGVSSALVLVGGFLLRYGLVMGPQVQAR